MKVSELKVIVKEAVKEAIQEELKDIMLEALKSPKSVVAESVSTPPPTPAAPVDRAAMRDSYMSALGNTAPLNTSNLAGGSFRPNPGHDNANGALPEGEVDMSQIMGLMNRR